MTIATIIGSQRGEVISVGCDTPVREAIGLLARHKIGAMPVLREGDVVGIVSERDMIYCLASDGAAMLDWPVERVMTTPVVTVTPDVPALAALSMMSKRRIRHLPVVEDNKPVGIVSIGDLVAYRIARIEQEAEAMRAYIQSA